MDSLAWADTLKADSVLIPDSVITNEITEADSQSIIMNTDETLSDSLDITLSSDSLSLNDSLVVKADSLISDSVGTDSLTQSIINEIDKQMEKNSKLGNLVYKVSTFLDPILLSAGKQYMKLNEEGEEQAPEKEEQN